MNLQAYFEQLKRRWPAGGAMGLEHGLGRVCNVVRLPASIGTPSGCNRLIIRPVGLCKYGLALVVLYVLLRGGWLQAVVPPWQGPDEPGHAAYALRLATAPLADPAAGDPALEAAVLRSMARHDFYAHTGLARPPDGATTFAEVPWLSGHTVQWHDETPIGYLPYALVAVITDRLSPAGVTDALGRMRVVSLVLAAALVPLVLAAGIAVFGVRHAPNLPHHGSVNDVHGAGDSARRGGRASMRPCSAPDDAGRPALVVAALAAACPMLGFASAVVNNDLPAALLAAGWWAAFAISMRRSRPARAPGADSVEARMVIGWPAALGLLVLAVAAALAKRTALYLLPLAAGLVVIAIGRTWRRWRARSGTVSRRRLVSLALLGVLALVLLAAWPLGGRAAGWVRVGAPWGAERTTHVARSGGHALRAVDRSTRWWAYLAQTVPLDASPDDRAPTAHAVRAVAWLRAAEPGATRAQLVVNDDAGTWLGRTVTLGAAWQPVVVSGTLAADAGYVRLALVPGDGTAAGTGALLADDVALSVGGRTLLDNGDAEAPRRLGPTLAGGVARYVAAERLVGALSGAVGQPAVVLARAQRGLGFLVQSFWGGFGWLTLWPGPAYRWLARALTAWSAAALLVALVAPRRLVSDPTAAALLRACALGALLAIATAVAGTMAGAAPDRLPQGRYLLAALVPLVLPAVALARRLAPRFGPLALVVLMLALDLVAVLGVMTPGFAPPIGP